MKRRIHLNLSEAANAYMGIGQFERNIATALWRLDRYSIDAVAHRVNVSMLPFEVRRGFFPKHFFFDWKKWHRFCPLTYNTMVGDFRSDVSIFFQNSIPVMKIRGKTIGVINDLIPFRIPDVLINDCHWFTNESLKMYCAKHEYLASHADKIVTLSEFSRREISLEFGIEPSAVTVIHPGVDSERFSRFDGSVNVDLKVKFKYNLPDRYILYFGTTAKYKNVENLIRGYARLPKVVRGNVRLVVTNGNDCLRNEARDNGVEDQVMFLPFIPEEDKPSVFRLSIAFAFLSRIEGFGMPPLEAMASGLPVLVSNCASLPEVVGDAALLVGPDDICGISENLERMIEDDSVREHLVSRGSARVSSFTWDSAALKMSEVIDSL